MDPRALPEADPWVLEVDRTTPTLTVFAVPMVGYPQLLLPWLTWALLAALAALAALGAFVAARREASRDYCTVLPAVSDASPVTAV